MKKTIIIAFLLFPLSVFSQTVDMSIVEHTATRQIIVTIAWEADGAGVATKDFDIDDPGLPDTIAGRFCFHAETIPGAGVAAGYDVTVSTPSGVSVFGTRLNDRSATVGEVAPPLVSSVTDNITSVFPVGFDSSLNGDVWTFTVINAGPGGKGVLRLFFR